MALTVGKLLALLDADPSGFDRGLDVAELRMRGFQRDVNGRLHDIKGRFISEGMLAGLGFGDGAEDGAKRSLPKFKMAGLHLGFALKSTLIESLIGGGAQLVTALAPAVGVLGLIPAAAGAGGIALATLKIGISGVGDAIKNSGDPEKYAEALKHLAPAAQETVKALVGLKPVADQLKQAVQQNLFAGFGAEITRVGRTYLPMLRVELGGVATGFNEVGVRILGMLTSVSTIVQIREALHNMGAAVVNVAQVLPGIVSGLIDITGVGAKFLPGLTAGFGDAAARFAAWMTTISQSGQLASWIQGGINAFKLLGGLLMDVGSILGSVFSAMGSAGGDALGVFGSLIHAVADFLQSANGMNALSAIFDVLGTVANATGSLLAQILPMVGDLLAQLLPVIAPLVGVLTGTLVPIIVKLAGTLTSALAPVLLAVIGILDAVLPAVLPIVDMLGGALGQAITALVPVVTALAQVVAQVLVAALAALMPVFQVLLPVIVQLVQAVLPALIPLIQLVGQLFMALMPAIAPLIQLLVALLVPILKLLTPVIQLVAWVLGLVATALIMVITPIANFIGWLARGLASAAMWRAIGHWFADLWRTISDAFMIGVRWIGQKWNEFIGLAQSIPGRVTAALGSFARLLVDKGADLVRGLWNGIMGMGSWLASKLAGFVKQWIPGPIANALGIGSPSKVAAALGRWVPVGLAVGMDAGTSQVAAAAARMAAAAVPTLAVPSLGQLAAAANNRPGAPGGAGPTTVQVFLGNDQLEPHMVRVIKGNPREVALANRSGTKDLTYTR